MRKRGQHRPIFIRDLFGCKEFMSGFQAAVRRGDPIIPPPLVTASGGQTFTHTHFTDNILRVGLNYQFH
jgi:hypothetical protein